MSRYCPRDTRWQGPQRHYFTVSTIRTCILLLFVVLIIVERTLLRKWLNGVSSTPAPYDFWARIGIYLLVDAAISLVMAICIYKGKWHPVAALVSAIFAFGLWVAACVVNALVVYSIKYWFKQMDQWRRIRYGEAALQAMIAVCYLVMMGFAANAVHVWRKGGRTGGAMTADQRVEELVMEARGERSMEDGEFVRKPWVTE